MDLSSLRPVSGTTADREALAEQLAVDLDRLPVLPAVHTACARSARGDDDATLELVELSHADPCYAVRILVAADALRRDVTPVSLRTAASWLGGSGLRKAVGPLTSSAVFLPKSDAQQSLWRHSIQVAVLSEAIAALGVTAEVDTGIAYAAGLLHDIGRFVTYFWDGDLPDRLKNEGADTPEDMIDREVSTLPVDHSRLAVVALTKWGLGEPYVFVCEQHHHSGLTRDHHDPAQALLAIVRLADFMSFSIMTNDGNDEQLRSALEEHLLFNPVSAGESPDVDQFVSLAREGVRRADQRFLRLDFA
jgi:putative nucleotidyltransferase with HDIG domain